MGDMLVDAYNFKLIKETIKRIMEKIPFTPYELRFVLVARPPTIESPLVKRFFSEGRLKSYQKKEIITKLKDAIKGALVANCMEGSLNRFSKIKNCSTIKVKTNDNEFRVSIIVKNLEQFSSNLLYAVVNHFNTSVLGYCDQVEIILSIARTKDSSLEVLLQEPLPKVPVSEVSKIVTLTDKDKILDFYRRPEVKEILFTHFFPQGLENDQMRTEITYDTLREETVAQKRRKVLLPSGEYENLHDAISFYSTHDFFTQIVEINDISGFYPSVRTTKTNEIVTTIIDIDPPGFLKNAFSDSVVWDLVMELTDEILTNLTDFLRLPMPLVSFSAGRGIHIKYKLDPDCVNADFNYVDYSELYLLPSQKSLAKNSKSLIHNKFTFIRSLMQAVLLYTVYNISRDKIPKNIREELGLVRIMDLFTLSVFSRNKVGVLLDTSSNNSSVCRAFSIHPTTGLVSIPLLDPETKKIRPELKKFTKLKQESTLETVIANLKAGKKDLYAQYPPEITKGQIKYMLRPDKLLPYLSVLVRFSDRWATERSPWSMKFWVEMYRLNNFYDYLLANLISIERSDDKIGTSYQAIAELIDNSKVKTKKYAKGVVDDFFFRNISYKNLRVQLEAFCDLEFYYRFKPDELSLLRDIELYIQKPLERRNLLQKFTSVFNIFLVLLVKISQGSLQIKSNTALAIKKLYLRLELFSREMKNFESKKIESKNLQYCLYIIQIACIFNIIIKFFRNLKAVLLLYSKEEVINEK